MEGAANPWAGEVILMVNGEPRLAKLTLGALAQLEASLEDGGLFDLVQRLEGGDVRSRDVFALVLAGLRGGGWKGSSEELLTADIEGGLPGAARAAARLLAVAFQDPGNET